MATLREVGQRTEVGDRVARRGGDCPALPGAARLAPVRVGRWPRRGRRRYPPAGVDKSRPPRHPHLPDTPRSGRSQATTSTATRVVQCTRYTGPDWAVGRGRPKPQPIHNRYPSSRSARTALDEVSTRMATAFKRFSKTSTPRPGRAASTWRVPETRKVCATASTACPLLKWRREGARDERETPAADAGARGRARGRRGTSRPRGQPTAGGGWPRPRPQRGGPRQPAVERGGPRQPAVERGVPHARVAPASPCAEYLGGRWQPNAFVKRRGRGGAGRPGGSGASPTGRRCGAGPRRSGPGGGACPRGALRA